MRPSTSLTALFVCWLSSAAIAVAALPERPAQSARTGAVGATADDDAIRQLRAEIRKRPDQPEGWWQLGTLLYDRSAYADAAAAFEHTTRLRPQNGNGWAMLGLCEYQLGRYDLALTHLQKAQRAGISADPQLQHVVRYHEGLLLVRKAEFERAQEVFDRLTADGVDSDDLTVSTGMSVLRLRPDDITGDTRLRDLALTAGRAEQLAARKQLDAARTAYEQLAREAPGVRNVNYAVGRFFVATERPDEASAAYHREIDAFPDHVPARLGLAAIKAHTDPAGALALAEQAVRLNPRIPLGHYLLGSLLLDTADVNRAIAELEIARGAVPNDPGVYYALGRAYARAGRPRDAEQARAVFRKLTEERQAAARRQ